MRVFCTEFNETYSKAMEIDVRNIFYCCSYQVVLNKEKENEIKKQQMKLRLQNASNRRH